MLLLSRQSQGKSKAQKSLKHGYSVLPHLVRLYTHRLFTELPFNHLPFITLLSFLFQDIYNGVPQTARFILR